MHSWAYCYPKTSLSCLIGRDGGPSGAIRTELGGAARYADGVVRLLLLFLIVPLALGAQPYERMIESERQVRALLVREAREITDRAAVELRSKKSWEAVAERRREELAKMLGLGPREGGTVGANVPLRSTPLNVRITGRIERPGYVVEKIAFESMPKFYVTANLYLPTDTDGPVPAVIYVCGHAFSEHGAKTAYQRHGHTLAKHGYAAMIIDPIQIAETFALHHGILNNEMYDWYSHGYTPAGVEVWNVMRALDYLETRPEIDSDKFGITGRSGGAAMSWFAAALDKRLKVVAPVMGISTYAANVPANTQRLHCDCMFPINVFRHDMIHQGALIAPRPLWMAHGRLDDLFPVEGYTEFEEVVGGLYESYGREEAFENLVVETGHKDSDLLRSRSVEWFDQWLMERPKREIDLTYEEIPADELSVFGGSPPEDAANRTVHESFGRVWHMRLSSGLIGGDRQNQEKTLAELRAWASRTLPAVPKKIRAQTGRLEAPKGFESFSLTTEPGVEIDALYRKARESGGPSLLWIASDGEDFTAIADVLRQVIPSPKNAILVLYPRGVGEVPWPKTTWKDIQRNAMHVGRTIDSMRLHDVLAGMRFLRSKSRQKVVLAGARVSGALGVYAAAIDKGLARAVLFDAPETERQAPIFLRFPASLYSTVAKDLQGHGRLLFYGQRPEIYGRAGAENGQRVVMTLEGALNGTHAAGGPSGL